MKGEAETEKGPGDLFPAERTDEGALRRGDLRTRGFEGSLGAYTKTALLLIEQGCFVYMRMKGLEPTRLRTRT